MFASSMPLQSNLLHTTVSQPLSFSSSYQQQPHCTPSWMSFAGVNHWSHQRHQQNNDCKDQISSSIKKHRSLEGVHQLLLANPSCSSAHSPTSQFIEPLSSYHRQFSNCSMQHNLNASSSTSLLQPLFPASSYFGASYSYPTTTTSATTINDSHSFLNQPGSLSHNQSLWVPSSSIGAVPQGLNPKEKERMGPADVDSSESVAWTSRIDDDVAAPLYQPVSAYDILQQVDLDPHALRRELASLCDRFNYLASIVHNFWAPELCRERHRWREQSRRANELEQQLRLLTAEAQVLRTTRRDEQQQIGRQPRGRDFTETNYTMHEWQTLKAKLERSELSLADRKRMLSEAELRAKGTEEQKAEFERQNEYLTRTIAANEANMKLLQEDLEMLRGKLEIKNQLLEVRDKERKRMESELEMSRAEMREQEHHGQDADRRVAQLTHKIDQLERDMRERDVQLERLRKRMLEPAAVRAETELQQKFDNVLEDRKKLEQLVDQLRAHNDAERLQQLEQFKMDREQMEMSIQCLKKELADRHVLISSQNEKISQLDNAIAKQQQKRRLLLEKGEHDDNVETEKQRTAIKECIGEDGSSAQNELDKTRQEIGRLLERVRELEREKKQRQQHIDGVQDTDEGKAPIGTPLGITICTEAKTDALKHRIHELEEALRESVGITSEREKALTEQKKLCQRLSDQVTELFEASAGDGTQHQRQLHDALSSLAEASSRLEEERLRNQRMVGNVRKELGMALVAEKEAAIALVQSCYGPDGTAPQAIRERIEQIHRQKERLRHALLTSATSCKGEKQQQDELIRALGNEQESPPSITAAVSGQLFSQPISIQTRIIDAQQNPTLGLSAPASLTYYGNGAGETNGVQQTSEFGGGVTSLVDEDGIWA